MAPQQLPVSLHTHHRSRPQFSRCTAPRRSCQIVRSAGDDSDGKSSPTKDQDPNRITEKWGLETGLFKVFTGKKDGEEGDSKTDQAKKLLGKYGSAYLITSIAFAIVSFGLCYALVTSGVDVASLLARIGIESSATGEKLAALTSSDVSRMSGLGNGLTFEDRSTSYLSDTQSLISCQTAFLQVGTFAIAYAAHKALSPIRFPPTVALTPIVARALGKKLDDESGSTS